MTKKFPLYLAAFLLILFFVFRNLILNISTNLLDWRDYAYIIWVMFQSITHITNLDFINFFETNAFYPNKLTLMFSDILLPQALILLPFLSLTKNLILSFNITFIITFILNFISLFLFWKQIFKKELIAFLGALFFIFSPFFHLELSHFQMLTFWPFFLALYFLFKYDVKPKYKYLILIGLLLTTQFLSSVYLSVYLIFAILIFYTIRLVLQKELKSVATKASIIFIVFILTGGIFIKGYIDMKNTYNIERDIKEYITYSANLSDYLFTSQIKSILHQSPLMQLWNKADKNWGTHSSFPGFLLFLLTLYGLFKLTKGKQSLSINLELNRQKAFFIILIISGFIFSLGPRVIFNGTYAHIPLPFSAVLKFIPLADATRVPARWSFIFFLGVIYFSLVALNKLEGKKYKKIIFFLIFVIFVLEYLPTNIQSAKDSYITSDYKILKDICSKEKKVLLELPLTHLDAYPNILEGLRYITVMELSSTYHNCFLVNGYSGYDLPDNFILAGTLSKFIENQQIGAFLEELRSRNIDYVKFNQYYFINDLKLPALEFVNSLATESGVEKINEGLFLLRRGSLQRR